MSAPSSDPLVPVPATIARVDRDGADVFTLTLDVAKRSPAFRFAPGQFNMLYLFGVGEVAISISGDPRETNELVHTIRAVGSVTHAMQSLRAGDTLGVRGPFGCGWPVDAAAGRDVLIIAGGVGLPPLRPVIYEILAHRERYRRVTVLYGARTPEDVLYGAQLEAWRARDIRVEVTVDHAPRSWDGHVGVVPALIDAAEFDPANTVAMMCGPEVMMRFAVRALQRRAVPDERVYLSMERNMKCAVGFCGHCQFGPVFVCKDGPVFSYPRIGSLLSKREV